MATNSDGYNDTFGADRQQETENRENEATEIADTDTHATREIKPDNCSEEIKESAHIPEQPNDREGLQSSTGGSKQLSLGRSSEVDDIGNNDIPEEATHNRNQPMLEAKDVSEDTHPVQGLERSREYDDGETGHPLAEGDSRHPPVDSNRKEVISLFVRNVAKHVVEQQLMDLFSKYGQVDSAVVVRDPHSKECRGFGFVSMSTEEGARAAIEAVQELDFEGRRISVERAKRRQPHTRTPGAYMGIDRRIRERYAGMKRHRDYEVDRYLPCPTQYDMRSNSYRGRYQDPNRPGLEERQWDNRVPYTNQHLNERNKFRKRFNADAPRYLPPRSFERDHRIRERGPPVPRESADDYI